MSDITVASTTDSAEDVRAAALYPATEEKPESTPSTDTPSGAGEDTGSDAGEDAAGTDAATETADEGQENDDDGEPKPKKGKGGFQKRIDKLTREKRDLAERLDRLERRLAEPASAAKPDQQTDAATAAAAAPAEKPKPEDFEDYEQYLDARDAWSASERRKTEAQEAQSRTQADEQTARTERWKQQVEGAAARYDDFEDVAFQVTTPISPPMQDAILDSDHGADIAYYLGQHQEEAARIAKLSPVAAVRAIGRIEAGFSVESNTPAGTKPGVSKAPPPIKPVAAQTRASGKTPDDMSPAEYRAWRASGGGR